MPEVTVLLAKIVAQILSNLVPSTRPMKEANQSVHSINILSLTTALTKEENLMMAARTLEATHHVDDKVMGIEWVPQKVDDNIKATQEPTSNVDHMMGSRSSHMMSVRTWTRLKGTHAASMIRQSN